MKKMLLAFAVLMTINAASFAQSDSIPMQQKKTPPKAVKYTCSMHKEVMESKPGKCPKCGMKLVAVKPKRSTDKEKPDSTM